MFINFLLRGFLRFLCVMIWKQIFISFWPWISAVSVVVGDFKGTKINYRKRVFIFLKLFLLFFSRICSQSFWDCWCEKGFSFFYLHPRFKNLKKLLYFDKTCLKADDDDGIKFRHQLIFNWNFLSALLKLVQAKSVIWRGNLHQLTASLSAPSSTACLYRDKLRH